ncbi:hypothetical protein QCA50_003204 [Cerrena zonata]|uniref:Uncharacterized protein n=1 Tax=Cerrena zonata TaxID=2478898 RepID=A0AAW0GRF6_9APHY
MELWSLFRKVRTIIFAFIAIISLTWASILSVYLAKEWNSFTILQRGIVIGMISMNGVTTVVQYLMAVCVFKIWVDFARMLFLVAIHVAAAVLYTMFGGSFSCKIFSSRTVCTEVELAFLAGSWGITGLLVGYTVCLCLMSRVPFPIPKITPNLLLDTPVASRRASTASINSTTHLLRRTESANSLSPMKDTPIPRQQVQEVNRNTSSKRLQVVNGMPSPISPVVSSPSGMYGLGSYGSIASPRMPPSAAMASAFSMESPVHNSLHSVASTPIPASLRSASSTPSLRSVTNSPAPSLRQNALARLSRTFSQRRNSRPPVLPLFNPFMEPCSRNGTPDSVYSTLTFNSAGSLHIAKGSYSLSPYQIPPLTGTNGKVMSEEPKVPESPSSIYSLYSERDTQENSDTQSMSSVSYHSTNPRIKSTISSPPRTHTATPNSVHSVAPSLHFHSETPIAHLRSYSDPVYRSYTASPHIPHGAPNPFNQPLSNPFPMVGVEVRRYASIGHGSDMRGQPYPSPLHSDPARQTRNAMHFQAALGRAPHPTASAAYRGGQQPSGFGNGYGGIPHSAGHGAPSITRSQWKQLVLSAAVSGR